MSRKLRAILRGERLGLFNRCLYLIGVYVKMDALVYRNDGYYPP